jgi:hypothetical protein
VKCSRTISSVAYSVFDEPEANNEDEEENDDEDVVVVVVVLVRWSSRSSSSSSIAPPFLLFGACAPSRNNLRIRDADTPIATPHPNSDRYKRRPLLFPSAPPLPLLLLLLLPPPPPPLVEVVIGRASRCYLV